MSNGKKVYVHDKYHRNPKAMVDFEKKYQLKTQASRDHHIRYKKLVADARTSVTLMPSIKNVYYPIVGCTGKGAYFTDIDDNQFLDTSFAFGTYLFGHSPDFITEAVSSQLQSGVGVGPQSYLAGKVASLINELTGVDRVAFCNSGTEAVMWAVRLARMSTGLEKIVIFKNSYHGLADCVLKTIGPFATTENPNVVLLDYDSEDSLLWIDQHAAELAAVLVEPVQSNNPGLQPKTFLQELRKITENKKVPLIFDEMITGFRIAPGGAQEYFGVKADIVTYGKIVGGGLPIGIVAGKEKYLDHIDGGPFNFGDNTFPSIPKILYGGTFSKNSLTMAASHAILLHLKEHGPSLQNTLNQRAEAFRDDVNRIFTEGGYPLKMVCFGSLFRFIPLQKTNMFYYHLIMKDIYFLENRLCFFSAVYQEKEYNYLKQSIIETLKEIYV